MMCCNHSAPQLLWYSHLQHWSQSATPCPVSIHHSAYQSLYHSAFISRNGACSNTLILSNLCAGSVLSIKYCVRKVIVGYCRCASFIISTEIFTCTPAVVCVFRASMASCYLNIVAPPRLLRLLSPSHSGDRLGPPPPPPLNHCHGLFALLGLPLVTPFCVSSSSPRCFFVPPSGLCPLASFFN